MDPYQNGLLSKETEQILAMNSSQPNLQEKT